MKYTFNIWYRVWGRILYAYGMLWYIPFKLIPFDMDNRFFVFVLKQFGGYCRNPYFEISQEERINHNSKENRAKFGAVD
jgi:hypothetical protein